MASTSTSADSSGNENWFVTTANGEALELSLDGLTDAIKTGKVALSALVWRAGMSEWVELEQVPLLQMIVAQLDLSRIPVALPAAPLADTAKLDALEEAEATVVQPAPILSITADCRFEPAIAAGFSPGLLPPLLDDADVTIVTQAPNALTPHSEDGLTASTQSPSPAVVLNDDEWTVEPQPVIATPTTKPALPIREVAQLARIGNTTASATRPIPASPQPNRPALVRPFSSRPIARDIEGITKDSRPQSLPTADATPARPSTSSPTGGVQPRVAPAASEAPQKPSLSERAPPKPRAVQEVANRVGQSDSRRTAPGTNVDSNRKLAPSPVSIRPQPAQAPHLASKPSRPVNSATASPSNLYVAPATASLPTLVKPAVVDAAPTPPPFPPKPAVVDAAPTPPPFPTANAAQANGLLAKPEKAAPFEGAESIGSLAPAVSSIALDMPNLRPSKRPLYLAVAAIAGVATLVFVFSVSSPTRKRSVVAARTLPPSPALTESSRTREPPPEVATLPTHEEAQATISSPTAVDTQAKAPTPRVNPPQRSVVVAKVADSSLNRPQVRDTAVPVAKRRVSEPKAVAREVSTVEKSPGAGPKKAEAAASSVASWDQGTVERRSWMSPGF